MSAKKPKNIAASVHQRLLSRAREDHRPFSELLQYYSMERFLYRLSQSPHFSQYILKGALMLRVWNSPDIRPTMDIDMLGKTSNEQANITAQIHEILAVEVEPDGLVFDPVSIHTERITEDANYAGIRVRFIGALDKARVHMQIDIGFGDIVYPGPEEADLPCVLDSPVPRVLCYSRESTIAEKFEAMAKLGELNSRMKDFYDIWLLSRQFNFEGETMAKAIRLTFDYRGTSLPAVVEVFSKAFIDAKQVQWSAFHKRLGQVHVPAMFSEVVNSVSAFLWPITAAILSGTSIPSIWNAPGPWIDA
jgi:hypothetical protein